MRWNRRNQWGGDGAYGERLHLLRPARDLDLLWCAEEALRAAPVALVIAEPEQPLSLIAGRRLQLAAEAGRTTGLMLIRENTGSNTARDKMGLRSASGPFIGLDSALLGYY